MGFYFFSKKKRGANAPLSIKAYRKRFYIKTRGKTAFLQKKIT
jgi:hypothetical protein